MIYNFDEIINREHTNSIKYDPQIIKEMFDLQINKDSLILWVADMDFQTPEPIIEAIRKRLDQKMFGYTTMISDVDYHKAVQNWFYSRYNWHIHKESIVFSSGTVSALKHLVSALTQEGDGVIIQRPVYPPFSEVVLDKGRTLVNNPLLYTDEGYKIDFDDLEFKASDPNNKLMILCNPHNPVGRVWTQAELIKLATICLKNDVLIISDEIHGDLVRREHQFTPLASLIHDDRIITCTAINKTFNTAGLHCSNIIIENEEYRMLFRAEQGFPAVTPFAIDALKAGYNLCDDWLNQVNQYLDENFKIMAQFFRDRMPKVRFYIAEGTYLAWVDFNAYELEPSELNELISKKANIVAEEGLFFGEEGQGFYRFNIACPRSILFEALTRLLEVLK